MKINWFLGIISSFPIFISGEILETDSIETIYSHVEEDTLVLLGMTDTITDSVLQVGSQPWRYLIRKLLSTIQDIYQPGNLHDQWTYKVETSVPVKAVQPEMIEWINYLQQRGIPVFCVTGRGRNLWYSTPTPDVDVLTERVLQSVGVDFSKTKIPKALLKVDSQFFYKGIFYCARWNRKGELLSQIFQDVNYRPKKIVMVDVKLDQLKCMEKKMQETGIPGVYVLYQKTAKNFKSFNSKGALLQLKFLIEESQLLGDAEAAEKILPLSSPSLEEYFKELFSISLSYQDCR